MNRILYIALFILLAPVLTPAQIQAADNFRLFLFTDRDFCVSGDSIWFKVVLQNGAENKSNVVHVQLVSPENNPVSLVKVKSEEGWAEGFIPVPDSLSTGVYFLSAFFNSQRNNAELILQNRSLFVYNRFENEVVEMQVPDSRNKVEPIDYGEQIMLVPDKTVYHPREKVTVKINYNTAAIEKVVIKAAVADPLAFEKGGIFLSKAKTAVNGRNAAPEKDGFILHGNVTSADGQTAPGKIVLLSIPKEMPYFDYCFTDQQGHFRFFLGDAIGTAPVYLQAVSSDSAEYNIQLKQNYLPRQNPVVPETKMLTPEQSQFIETAVDGSFFNKIFNGMYAFSEEELVMPSRFSFPFYGQPEDRVVPAEFIYLDDFREISRELLHGVQYREKRGEVSLRVLNKKRHMFFRAEPFKVINGIPVFNNRIFRQLDSDDIEYVDFVFEERLFGDLLFNGVLAVSLTDKSNNWLITQPQVKYFSVPCLQAQKVPGYLKIKKNNEHTPDSRSVYYWESRKPQNSEEIQFHLSDVKGKVEISVEAVNEAGKLVKSSKIIEVQ